MFPHLQERRVPTDGVRRTGADAGAAAGRVARGGGERQVRDAGARAGRDAPRRQYALPGAQRRGGQRGTYGLSVILSIRLIRLALNEVSERPAQKDDGKNLIQNPLKIGQVSPKTLRLLKAAWIRESLWRRRSYCCCHLGLNPTPKYGHASSKRKPLFLKLFWGANRVLSTRLHYIAD